MKFTREYLKRTKEAFEFEDQEPKLHGEKKKPKQSPFMSFLTTLFWKPMNDYLWRRKIRKLKRR